MRAFAVCHSIDGAKSESKKGLIEKTRYQARAAGRFKLPESWVCVLRLPMRSKIRTVQAEQRDLLLSAGDPLISRNETIESCYIGRCEAGDQVLILGLRQAISDNCGR